VSIPPDRMGLINELNDDERHFIVLQQLDEIVKATTEFISDDGPWEDPTRLTDIVDAARFMDLYTKFHQIEEDTA
jgi:hypothetical protein